MPASIKTVLTMDDKQLKASLDSIKKYMKDTYSEIGKATQEASQASDKLEQSQRQLIKSNKALRDEKVKLKKSTKEQSIEQKKVVERIIRERNAIKDNIASQRIDIANRKRKIIALKQESIALNKATLSAKVNEKTTGNLANTTIRYLRWAGTLVGVTYALSRAWGATIGRGLEVNRMMEDNTAGISALLSANTQMVLSNGQIVDSYEKFAIGQTMAGQTMEDLRKASVKTFATFPQLTEIFQQAIGQTLAMGDSFGSTTQQIIDNTVKLSQRMSNIAGAIGMPMDRVREEIRSLLSGNASTDSLISTMIFGSPTEANKAIRMAKDRGTSGVKDMLDNMLKPFDALEGVDTYTRSLLTLEDAWSNTTRILAEPVAEDLKVTFKDLAKEINENAENLAESFERIYDGSTAIAVPFGIMVEAGKSVSEMFVLIGKSAKETFKILGGSTEISAFSTTMLGLSVFSTTMLGLSVMLETVGAGLANFGTVASSFTFSMSEGFGFDISKANKEILTIDDITAKYAKAYNKIVKTTSTAQAPVETIETNQAKATKKRVEELGKLQTKHTALFKAVSEAEKKTNREKDKTIKLQEEILKNAKQIAVAEKALAKVQTPTSRVALTEGKRTLVKRNRDIANQILEIEKTEADKKAKIRDKAYNKIRKDSIKQHKLELKGYEEKRKKAKQLASDDVALKKRQIEATTEGIEKAIALATIEADSIQAQIEDRRMLGKNTKEYYDKLSEAEKQIASQIQFNYTKMGQIIQGVAQQMETSLGSFFDHSSEKFADFGNLAQDILGQILKDMIKIQIIKPITGGITGELTSFFGGGASAGGVSGDLGGMGWGFAQGDSFSGSPSLSTHSNSVVSKPTAFMFATGGVPNLGIMGEERDNKCRK